VIDSGPGVPLEKHEAVFESFFRGRAKALRQQVEQAEERASTLRQQVEALKSIERGILEREERRRTTKR